MKYERLTNSKFIKDKINTCSVFHSCALCPYFKDNKFPDADYVGGCEGYYTSYIRSEVPMEKAEYLKRLVELENMIDSGELDKVSEVAEKILKRLLSWKSSVLFDTDSVTIAEKNFTDAIVALAKEEYGIEI